MTFDPSEPRGKGGRWTHLAGLMKSEGGFTHALKGGDLSKGIVVGIPAPGGKDWKSLPHGSTSAKDIKAFAKEHADELAKPNRAIGGWSNGDPGEGDVRDALDIVEVHSNYSDAYKAASAANQDGVFDLGSGEYIGTPDLKGRAEKERAMHGNTHNLSVFTPSFSGEFDLSVTEGKLAFWKQVLPMKTIHYTAKDGSRRTLDFNRQYLTDLANNKAVDKIPFMLADSDNRHTMDPERYRGDVVDMAVRDDGLYAKIVFPSKEAAKAVLSNPELPVSARIREGVQRSDGSTVSRGIIHVLGTLDPQVSGMSGWQTTDLSNEADEVVDLTTATYEDGSMGLKKPVTEYTEDEINDFSDEDLAAFLDAVGELADEGVETEGEHQEPVEKEDQRELVSLSNEARGEIDLANARANEALRRLAEAQWEREKDSYLNAGVPPHLLDLAKPVLNRPDDFVVDLSNSGESDVDVSKIVRGLLDATKGTIDLSTEQGHGGTYRQGDEADPDTAALKLWDEQF